MLMAYLEYSDHPDLFVEHGFTEQLVDLGEIRMNYAVAGDPAHPALLLIPGQSESWWGYEEVMKLLSDRYQVYAVDLRGQGRSTWTPGRYSLDLFGNDLVRFIDRVIRAGQVDREVVACGLSSGGVIAAWLSAFAAPGQIRAAYYEDPPLFSSQTNPAVGQSIRQGIGAIFRIWHKWLGPQWSIGDYTGMQAAMNRELPEWMGRMQLAGGAATASSEPPQNLREYDPEWGDAFISGRVAITCDHEAMLQQVKVPVLFTHHSRFVHPETGNLLGAISDQQVAYVRHLIEGAGNTFTLREFPEMPHSMHGSDPQMYAETLEAWLAGL
jgi:pimeloyl-ACP methyl ester carboxylesterase